MTRPTISRGKPASTVPIDSASLNVGMMAVTDGLAADVSLGSSRRERGPGSIDLVSAALIWIPASARMSGKTGSPSASNFFLQAPAQAAIGASLGRPVGFERVTEGAIGRPGPDLAQALLCGIAERVVLVAALRERRDAAWQRAAIGGEIHHRPRPAAQRPWRAVIAALETDAGLGCAAGGAKRDAELFGKRGRALDMDRFRSGKLFVERLIGPRHANGVFLEKHEPLQMHFLDAGLGGDADEIRQFLNGLAQAGEPGGDLRLCMTFTLLQSAKRADVFENAIEIILTANGAIGLRIGGVERDAQLVQTGRDQGAAVLLVKHRAVGIEQHKGAAILQITHHARQVLDQHRLTDAVQHRAL